MNILVISPFLPYPLDQGGKIRVFNLVKHLSSNHRVTLACISETEPADLGPLPHLCDEIVTVTRQSRVSLDLARFLFLGKAFNCCRFSSSAFSKRLTRLVSDKNFDMVQIEFSLLWQYARLFPNLPVALDAHNIECNNVREIGKRTKSPLKRLLYQLETRRLEAVEHAAWRECTVCFSVSENEREEIALRLPDGFKVVTAANGVDPERFVFTPSSRTSKRILLLGGMDYSPNLDAARFFLRHVFPQVRLKEPSAQVLMVGRELFRLGDDAALPGVECHESVPDVLPWFYEADILAVPLRQGAGTRIKVLEAMAAGLPIVTTSKGCEGIQGEDGRDFLVADTAEKFASGTLRLLAHPELRLQIADNAHRLVIDKYTWRRSAEIVDTALQRFAGGKGKID
ncbi:glycosyltransferase [Geomonas edaphica]|uniref:glycosyltransferase n=1 Tax=Geomonas edaphica TaxID=2570226 RepID=UPI0010A7B81B|nr:glycosyltransferase [Geomonas edaphica]